MSAKRNRLDELAASFAESHKRCNESRPKGLPWDRLKHVLDALIALVKLVVAYREEHKLKATENMCDDGNHWQLWLAAECEIKDLRELAALELQREMLPNEVIGIGRLEDLIRFMLYGPWQEQAPLEAETYLWKLERHWNTLWDRLRIPKSVVHDGNRLPVELREESPPQSVKFAPLHGWGEIIDALNKAIGNVHFSNDAKAQSHLRLLNEQHNGPIILPRGRGKQPEADKFTLLVWWKAVQERWEARAEEREANTNDERHTVADSYQYGRNGTVVPGIKGSVKHRKRK